MEILPHASARKKKKKKEKKNLMKKTKRLKGFIFRTVICRFRVIIAAKGLKKKLDTNFQQKKGKSIQLKQKLVKRRRSS